MNIGQPYTNNTYLDIDNIDSNLDMSKLVMIPALRADYWATNVTAIRFGPRWNNMTFIESYKFEAIIDSAYPYIKLPRSEGKRIIELLLRNLKQNTYAYRNEAA